MKIHEYQGKAVLAQYGVPVPKGKVAYTVDEAVEAAKGLGFPVVVKAQIHAGGRGKGGGVKLARTATSARRSRRRMLGMTLRTHQTGPEGRVVRRLLIEQGMDLDGAKEMYLAILVDRATGRPVFMASAQGGMDIEEVAAKDPKAILKETVDPVVGFQPFQARKLAFGLGISPGLLAKAVRRSLSLYRGLRGRGCLAPRDQPVPGHEGGRRPRPRRQDQLRRQRPLPPPGPRGAARPRRRGAARRSRPQSSASTTSSSTAAASAAW